MIVEETEKRYPITCPHCEVKLSAAKSLGMSLEIMTTGHGTCAKCKRVFKLTYNAETDSMDTSIDEISQRVNEQKSKTEKDGKK